MEKMMLKQPDKKKKKTAEPPKVQDGNDTCGCNIF